MAAAAVVTTYVQPAHSAGTLIRRIDAVSGPSGTLAARLDVFALPGDHIAESPLIGVGLGFDPARIRRRASGSDPQRLPERLVPRRVIRPHGSCADQPDRPACRTANREGCRTPDERLLAGSLLGSFAAYMVFGLGTPALYERYGWVPVALVVALRAIQLRRSAEDGGRGA